MLTPPRVRCGPGSYSPSGSSEEKSIVPPHLWKERLDHPGYGRRSRSSTRRSRLVGRPAPGGRRNGCGPSRLTTGGGGLWSMKHFAATAAPTRFSMTVTTSNTRSRSTNASTRSPAFTCVEAFAVPRFTRTFPPRQAVVAADRVLKSRTAQSQASTRVVFTTPSCHGDDRPSTPPLRPP